jgi:hypothetical protein
MREIAEYIIIIFGMVPEVIWAAIIASFLTFLGVLLTNRGNHQSLAMQLLHEKEKAIKEQDTLLKKDVYLEVAATFAQSLSAISKLSDIGIPVAQLTTEVSSHSPSAAKLYVTGKQETVENAILFSDELGTSFLNLLQPRAKIDDINNAIIIHQDVIDRSTLEQQRLLMIIKELNLNKNLDEHKMDYLNKGYQLETKIIANHYESKNSLESTKSTIVIEHSKQCLEEHCRLTKLIIPLIKSIRSELNTHEINEKIDQIFDNSLDKMINSYDTFINEFTNNKG